MKTTTHNFAKMHERIDNTIKSQIGARIASRKLEKVLNNIEILTKK